MLTELKVLYAQVGDLLDPSTRVVKEEQKRAVTKRESAATWEMVHKVLDFIAFEEVRFGRSHPLHGNGCHALTNAKHLGCSAADVLEETVDGGQALVAGADVVGTVSLEVAQKADHPVEGEIVEAETRDFATAVR